MSDLILGLSILGFFLALIIFGILSESRKEREEKIGTYALEFLAAVTLLLLPFMALIGLINWLSKSAFPLWPAVLFALPVSVLVIWIEFKMKEAGKPKSGMLVLKAGVRAGYTAAGMPLIPLRDGLVCEGCFLSVDARDNYCHNCGSQFGEIWQRTKPRRYKTDTCTCSNCPAKVREADRYCRNCGQESKEHVAESG